MTDVSAKHDVVLVLKNRGGEARPDDQPVKQKESYEVTPMNNPNMSCVIKLCSSPLLTRSKVQKFSN